MRGLAAAEGQWGQGSPSSLVHRVRGDDTPCIHAGAWREAYGGMSGTLRVPRPGLRVMLTQLVPPQAMS